jgi:adenosylcobinamide-GDP ribazoletransferase
MALGARLAAAIVFYTCIPLPVAWTTEFQTVAQFAPLVGLLIGGLLGLADYGLDWLGMPVLTRSALVVAGWVALTGGLHLDGAMDTADGLAVTDPDRRLQVMADSVTGAFGAMAAAVLLLVKTAAFSDLEQGRWLSLMLACGWGRWGQQVAIARYPYLKPTGKGAFHKQAIRSLWDTLPSLLLLLSLSLLAAFSSSLLHSSSVRLTLTAEALLPHPLSFILYPLSFYPLSFLLIACLVPAWFHHKLRGHTGDSYGATVEWTEALVLVMLTALS